NPQDMAHADPAIPAPPARPLLATITAPTLILVGEYDIADNHAQAGAAEALMPNAKRIVVTDAGHMLYMEHPDVFAGLVAQFVSAAAK
ncbi:MAG TPA: alpha/beta hydrolase, partial [Rhizomicrobium sp.]